MLACGLAGAWWMRPGRAARAMAPLPEFERAIRRAGWSPPPPGTTLAALERRLRGSPAAQAYARALREQRYRAGAGPTADQRRRLRTELARGGPLARARAWWALPPRRD